MIKKTDFQIEYFSSVTQRKVEWLWYPYIPYGKLTIIQGDPGEGKSTFILNIAALLTNGKPMPDGSNVAGPQKVIYQTAEDNLADTVKPRLITAGANCDQVAYIIDDEGTLTLEDSRIEEAIKQTNARLFILDPIQAYLSNDTDMFSPGKMRQKLKHLADIAAKYRCAVVVIGHMNKTSGEKNLYRGLGSIDIAAIARSVLMISRDKSDPSIRYMFPVKSSLAPEGSTIAFSLESKRGLKWIGTCEVNKDQIQDYDIDESKWALTIRVIRELLDEQDIRSIDVLNKLKILGISERTAHSVKKQMGVTSYKKDNVWYWHLEDQPCKEGC
ncbi:MAG: AAA family ATPase [Eubacterium sp.]|nr:AAA family ATPase [Eubacterium sp.]